MNRWSLSLGSLRVGVSQTQERAFFKALRNLSVRCRGWAPPPLTAAGSDWIGTGAASEQSNPDTGINPGRYAAFRSAIGPGKRRDGRNAPCSSSAMSSDRLILDRVARQHCPSPLHRQLDHTILDRFFKRIYHRTVSVSFPPCLTGGVHPIIRVHSCLSVANCF